MAQVYATWDDVVLIYELPIPATARPRIEALLKQAAAKLTALVPSLPARLTAGSIDAELPKAMVVDAVLRVYRNPAGVSQQATGPFSRSLTKLAQRNDIYFEPEQVAALLVDSSAGSGVGTFRVGIPAPQVAVTGLDADGRYLPIPQRR